VGFYKGSNGIVCKNCAAPINPQSVGQPGGCNPIPLETTQNGDTVVVRAPDLKAHIEQFTH
jgi:high-affinity iron transporter